MATLADRYDAEQVAHLRSRIWTALEALAVGDQALAVAALLAAVEDGPAAHGERGCPLRCGWQGFPGALEHHLLLAHGYDWDEIEAAVHGGLRLAA